MTLVDLLLPKYKYFTIACIITQLLGKNIKWLEYFPVLHYLLELAQIYVH